MEWDARGMYVHLLCMAWQETPPGSIPNDDAVIRRWLNLSRDTEEDLRTWRRVRPQIMAAWTLRDNRWYQNGLVETWERQQRRSQANTNNVRTRYESYVDEVQELPNKEVSKKISEEHIGRVYEVYPRKVGKGAALKAIAAALHRILKGEDSPGGLFASMDDAVVYLIQRVRIFSASPAGRAGEYTPHPATWFNQKRYLDDESEWSRHGKDRQPVKQSRAREVADNNLAAFAAAMGENPMGFGAVSPQRTDYSRDKTLAGEVKRLPE